MNYGLRITSVHKNPPIDKLVLNWIISLRTWRILGGIAF
jgi:hypothetical protein